MITNKLFLFLLAFLVSPILSFSYSPLVAYKLDKTWHFSDTKGNIQFKRDDIVELGGYGDGFYNVLLEQNGKKSWHYLDLEGNIAISPKSDGCFPFNDSMAIIYNITDYENQEMLMGFINTTGEVVVPMEYLDANNFSEGKAYVMNFEKRGYLNKEGKFVFDMADGIVGYSFKNGLAAVSNSNYQVGFINAEGELIIDYIFDEPSIFKNGLARVNSRGKFGFVDTTGDYRIIASFDDAKHFNDSVTFGGLFEANFNVKWALINLRGQMLSEWRFDAVNEFYQGVAAVKSFEKWGFIDKKGDYLFEENYSFCHNFADDGLAYVADNDKGKFGFVDKSGKMIVTLPKADDYFDLRYNVQLHKVK